MDNIVFNTIKRYNMLDKGDVVIVALSGGADSMALFHFLLSYSLELDIKLMAVHINHNLREESAVEAAGVMEYCKSKNVKLLLQELFPQKNVSENWAREQRYAFFNKVADEYGAKIATAHTATDNAETLLFRLCRGTGIKGAGAIPMVRNCFIRPFIEITREDTEAYCKANKLAYYIDKTNLTSEYTRGYIRNEVMPTLEKIHPKAKNALSRFALTAREINDYMQYEAEKLLVSAKRDNGYDVAVIINAPPALQKCALALIAQELANIDLALLEKMQELLINKRSAVNLKNGNSMIKSKGLIYITHQKIDKAKPFELPFQTGLVEFEEGKLLEIKLIEYEEFLNFKKVKEKDLIFYADYDKIAFDTCFRTRRNGDIFSPQGRNITKSLKKLMNESGIARDKRFCLPLLARENKIFWIYGMGFSEDVKITKDTKKALSITDAKEI